MDYQKFVEICNEHEIAVKCNEYPGGYGDVELSLMYVSAVTPTIHLPLGDDNYYGLLKEASEEYSADGNAVEMWSRNPSYSLREIIDDAEKFGEKIEDVLEGLLKQVKDEEDARLLAIERERALFVEFKLKYCIVEAFDWVMDVYHSGDLDEEYVVVHCNNGHEYRVNVTMDSYGAIIEDVVRECLRH